MCGRYTLDPEGLGEEVYTVLRSFRRVAPEEFSPGDQPALIQRERFPGEKAPVYLESPGGIRMRAVLWGFPSPGKRGWIINARAETVRTKPLFSESFYSGRCVLPAGGFYEWEKKSRDKVRYTLPGELFYMAGIYRSFSDGLRFVILTVPANASVRPVHPRMPLVLQKEDVRPWLESTEAAERFLEREPPLFHPEVCGQRAFSSDL